MVPATAQFIYLAHDLDKPEIIGRVLQAEDAGKIIVFTRTKRQAQRVADDLAERGFRASALHGDMAQVAREKALTRFREDKLDVLVSTDVAARGIDVRGVSHVINYTCPEDDKTYIHRIGRTGRAGATGIGDHVRRLGRRDPLEGHQQDPRPAVRRAAGDLLDLRAPLPRPGHPAGHQGPASSTRLRSSAHPGPTASARGPPQPRRPQPDARPPGRGRDRRHRRQAVRGRGFHRGLPQPSVSPSAAGPAELPPPPAWRCRVLPRAAGRHGRRGHSPRRALARRLQPDLALIGTAPTQRDRRSSGLTRPTDRATRGTSRIEPARPPRAVQQVGRGSVKSAEGAAGNS